MVLKCSNLLGNFVFSMERKIVEGQKKSSEPDIGRIK